MTMRQKRRKCYSLAPYMAYAKQYLNIHNTIFRVNLKINNGKLGSWSEIKTKMTYLSLEWASQKIINEKLNGIKTILH